MGILPGLLPGMFGAATAAQQMIQAVTPRACEEQDGKANKVQCAEFGFFPWLASVSDEDYHREVDGQRQRSQAGHESDHDGDAAEKLGKDAQG